MQQHCPPPCLTEHFPEHTQLTHSYGCMLTHHLLGTGSTAQEARLRRKAFGVVPSFKRVDTCAAEFQAATPYLYSSYDGDCECEPTNDRKVLILGAGPNRIGQGIEFDYCCCHASFALRCVYVWAGAPSLSAQLPSESAQP